jgi:hypothetical protein
MEPPHHEEKEQKTPNRAMGLNERHRKQPASVFSESRTFHSINSEQRTAFFAISAWTLAECARNVDNKLYRSSFILPAEQVKTHETKSGYAPRHGPSLDMAYG